MPATNPPGLTVNTLRGPMTIPLRSRTRLLRELGQRPDAAALREEIVNAGVAGAITLDPDRTVVLLSILSEWKSWPLGIFELQSALNRDLRLLNPAAFARCEGPDFEPAWEPRKPSLARVFAPDRKPVDVPEEEMVLFLDRLDAGGPLERAAADYIRTSEESQWLQPDARITRGLLEGLGRLNDSEISGSLRRLRFELDSAD